MRFHCIQKALKNKPTVWYVYSQSEPKDVFVMSPALTAYGALAAAIVLEVIGTTLLQKSAQFTKLLPTAGMVMFYVASFYLLSQALKGMPLGIAYAMWGGLGIVLTALISVFYLKQSLDLAALAGIALIVTGVIVMNTLSSTVSH